jgi:hypothetical protein
MRSSGVGQLRWSGKPAMPRGASPKRVGAPRPAHEDRRRVRRLGTDGAVETEARHDRGGLPKGGNGGGADKMNRRVLFYRGEHRDRQDGSALAASARSRHVSSVCTRGSRWCNERLLR